MNPVHSPSSCYYNIHFNIILPPANRSLPFKFYGQNSACILRSLKHTTFSYCDMALLRELKSTNANVKLLAVALPCMKFPALMESEVCCRVLKGFPLLSISQANVRPKVTSLEHFATLLERFQVTHIYIMNILLYDCTNDGMMWQTERGCTQNKEKGTVILKVCTKGPPILRATWSLLQNVCSDLCHNGLLRLLNHAAQACHDAPENTPSPSSEWQNLKTRKAYSSKPSKQTFAMRCQNTTVIPTTTVKTKNN